MAEQREKGSGTQPHEPSAEEKEERPAPSPVGQPDPRTIIAEKPYVSPKGNRYTIVETNELDPYEEPTPSEKPPEGRGLKAQPVHRLARRAPAAGPARPYGPWISH
jgi:hypothetical protein